MSEASNHKSFTIEDIERYHRGTMPAVERNALEKAALDDPFLADALDGFAFTNTPAADIQYLQKRLEEKSGTKKIYPIGRRLNWLQVAATVILLAGAAWFLFTTDLFNKREIAVASPGSKKQEFQESKRTEASDTSFSAAAPEASKEQNLPVSPPVVNHQTAKTKKPVAKRETENEVAITAPVTSPGKEFMDQNVAVMARSKTADAISVNPSVAGANKTGLYDSNKRSEPDSVQPVAETAFMYRKQANDSLKDLNIVMQPLKEGMSEVVVVELGVKNKAFNQPPAKFEQLEPAEGWTNYNNYIVQNLKEPGEIKQKTIAGSVELSFDVNSEGQAINIKIEKSLCNSCDEEAIRLLKNGPKWKQKNKKGRVSIHFNE